MISARDNLIIKESDLRSSIAEQNLVVNRSLNYTELVVLDHDKMIIYHIIGHFLLQTGASIKKRE